MRRRPSHTPSSDVLLDLQMERQLRDNWCWAAVAVSVLRHYRSESREQCQHADRVLGKQTCCAGDEGCDVPANLIQSLSAADLLDEHLGQPLPPTELRRYLENRQIVCALITWDEGGGHFVAIDGIFANQQLSVKDPIRGEVTLTHPALLRYQGRGRWTETFTIKP